MAHVDLPVVVSPEIKINKIFFSFLSFLRNFNQFEKKINFFFSEYLDLQLIF